ncbi:response regulator [Streptomyces marispadix]|uniref:Response regulator n=1 Tax=Streptomyces marispadix TaxID=2922868 RepID=A0ABS9SZ82_9ACTN|nr:response regulator [Streptomyces marispadix]MCH6161581.1 response regulator [Streptomyces marispadix]
MIQQLTNMRILVADDQTDVARTLCRPLQKAGARLRFAADGHAALQEITDRPFDLVLVDMKMPPAEWGGLWLLRQLKHGGWRIPSLVLSGEGSKQQVIEALRLDADDWIVKDAAGEELLERCLSTIADHLRQSLEFAAAQLPTPLAHRLARYARTDDPNKKVLEGLHTLEAVLRFTTALGLSSTPPAPLRGITPERLATPSMRTWFALSTALSGLPGAGNDFARMFSCLVPERSDHQPVQDLISMRNALAHGRDEPTPAQAEQLDSLLRRFAHRAASSWRANLTVPVSMTYDGAMYVIHLLSLKGVGRPVPDKVMAQAPVITGQPLLVSGDTEPLPLAPWLLTSSDPAAGTVRCQLFDGLQHAKGGRAPNTPFTYTKTDEGIEMPTVSHPAAQWQTLAQWIAT